ncbi:MAG: DNA phosphorothioation-associated putative methyltransferase [Glaciimonas sp.]|nr:DNA phosphorothioation-associated putative methyltransferase [Glaciimonas sp.]
MKGKQVGAHFYWHYELTTVQPLKVRELVADAEILAGLIAGKHYNIVKYPKSGSVLSLLWYPDFFDAPFPVLHWGWTIDCTNRIVKRRSYSESLNAPILHRKELFLAENHVRHDEYVALTQSAELLGLFENSRNIGFKLAWEALINERGYYLDGDKFLPIGNDDDFLNNTDNGVELNKIVRRHLTALTRHNLSAPMQALARFNFLDGKKSIFDYGCGRGDDVRNLQANNILVSGWDPHFLPDGQRQPADIVNLGFVINVIENLEERLDALKGAYFLAKELLVVSAMLYNQNSFKGQKLNDGVLTARSTFQKYFTQTELKEFIDDSLNTDSIPVGPGIFFVFSDVEAEQRFLLSRQRSKSNLLHLSRRTIAAPRASIRDQKQQNRTIAITPLRDIWLSLGRQPRKDEIENIDNLITIFGTVGRATRFLLDETDPELLEQAANNRINDLLVYFALYIFSQRKTYRNLDSVLQIDVKVFFGNYSQAIEKGRALLFKIADAQAIESACKMASQQGLGYYDEKNALHLPTQLVERLPPLLRVYIGCAAMLYGDIASADMIKIHIGSGKLTLLRFDDFYGSPLPLLLERVKIKFRSLDFDFFSYGEEYESTYLYLKSRYLNEESFGYAEQIEFDEKLEELNLFSFEGYGPRPQQFRDMLATARWQLDGMYLTRSKNIPDIDTKCGRFLSYRMLIECGETWENIKIDNSPRQADSFTALYDLATNILDPVIDYFGMIRLTYAFCSAALGKKIPGRIAPKLDQHASCELTRMKTPICSRLGAAVDFFVEDENMLEVAEWISVNTPFDRIYFYGIDKPIHVSYGPENKKDFIEMKISESGRLIPFRRN